MLYEICDLLAYPDKQADHEGLVRYLLTAVERLKRAGAEQDRFGIQFAQVGTEEAIRSLRSSLAETRKITVCGRQSVAPRYERTNFNTEYGEDSPARSFRCHFRHELYAPDPSRIHVHEFGPSQPGFFYHDVNIGNDHCTGGLGRHFRPYRMCSSRRQARTSLRTNFIVNSNGCDRHTHCYGAHERHSAPRL